MHIININYHYVFKIRAIIDITSSLPSDTTHAIRLQSVATFFYDIIYSINK